MISTMEEVKRFGEALGKIAHLKLAE